MITLTKRLQTIADLVPACELIADVGTDHAYLPVFLVQSGKVRRSLAADLREGPLQRARETIRENGLTDQIRTVLANGLSFPGAEQADVITICGMGGETILSILQAAPWTRDRVLILQPQSKLPELEAWLSVNGYGITHAVLCLDSGKLYLALTVTGGAWKGSAESLLLQLKDPLLPEYLRRETAKAQKTLTGLTASALDRAEQIQWIKARLQTLSNMRKEMETW